MMFNEKIQQIEEILGNSKKFKNKNLLATAIYFKIRTDTSFRKIPLNGIPFTWYNLRYWLQRLEKLGKMQEIQNIVGGGANCDESYQTSRVQIKKVSKVNQNQEEKSSVA